MSAERAALEAALVYSANQTQRIKALEGDRAELRIRVDSLQRQLDKVRNAATQTDSPIVNECSAQMPSDMCEAKPRRGKIYPGVEEDR